MRSALTPPATIFAWAATPCAGTSAQALFDLDATLGQVVRTTTEPLVGQMRLTWWHESLERLDRAPPPAQPVLQALAARTLPTGVTGARLAVMIDGWEELLDPDLPDDALRRYGDTRGGALFRALTGNVSSPVIGAAGCGWALADLSAHVDDADVRARAGALALGLLTSALAQRWPTPIRAAGAIALDALMALRGRGAAGSPRRAAAVLRFRLLGRA